MAGIKRKQYQAAFKVREALETVKGVKTIAQVASEYWVHTNQVHQLKERLLSVLPDSFSNRRKRTDEECDKVEAELCWQIGQLKEENKRLKKFSAASIEEKRQLVEKDNRKVSISRQCELLDLSKSSYYYTSGPNDDYNLKLMGLIDEQCTNTPFYGVRRMTPRLRAQDHRVNVKRVRKLSRRLGLQAVYPRKKRSFSSPVHKLYPYMS